MSVLCLPVCGKRTRERCGLVRNYEHWIATEMRNIDLVCDRMISLLAYRCLFFHSFCLISLVIFEWIEGIVY